MTSIFCQDLDKKETLSIRYLLVLFLFTVSMPVFAQLATYSLDGNLLDTTNSYDANSTGSVSFLTEAPRSFARLDEDGVITLPSSLGSVLASNHSLKFEFEFKINNPDSVSDCCYPIIFLSNRGSNEGYWGGFTLKVLHFPGFTPEQT